MTRQTLSTLLLVTACPSAPSGGDATTPAITSVSATLPGDASEPGEDHANSEVEADSAGASSSDEVGGPALDVGSASDLGDGAPVGCDGKIDFLFVVSREAYLEAYQPTFIAAFPAFFATIEERFAGFDFHAMVIDGDAQWGVSQCNETCTPEGCALVEDYPCELSFLVSECDVALGAGTVFPAGRYAANRPCGVDGGRRYLTREQTDLEETFACIGQVGVGGGGKLGEALTVAMGAPMNAPGGCNHGFLRPDALLMVTLIGDWDVGLPAASSAGNPKLWAQAVLDAKHGDAEAVVMLSIGDPECPMYYDRVCEMAVMFPYHHVGNRFAPDFGPDFAAASELVEAACAGFVPPG